LVGADPSARKLAQKNMAKTFLKKSSLVIASYYTLNLSECTFSNGDNSSIASCAHFLFGARDVCASPKTATSTPAHGSVQVTAGAAPALELLFNGRTTQPVTHRKTSHATIEGMTSLLNSQLTNTRTAAHKNDAVATSGS